MFIVFILMLIAFGRIVSSENCVSFREGTQLFEIYCENCAKTGQGYSLLDSNLSKVNYLKFVGCNTEFVSNTIENSTSVKSIDISYSKYELLNAIYMKCQALTEFNASHNKLNTIPRRYFENASKLTRVDLAYNEFVRIEFNTFEGARAIKMMNLSHNDIIFIDENAFSDLINLEFLDLSINQLTSIQKTNVFLLWNNSKLSVLHLENNPIRELNSQYIPTMSKISVYISWKNVETFKAKSNRIKFVVRGDADSTGIFPSKQMAYEICCGDLWFNSFQHIKEFLAASNQFENVSDMFQCLGRYLNVLDISGNTVEKLNADVFKRFKELKWLGLRQTKLVEFDVSALKCFEIENIDISLNSIKQIKNAAHLEKFHTLRRFNITGNHIANTIELIQQMKYASVNLKLAASDNYVGEINETTFGRWNKVDELHLSNTNLSIVDFKPFAGMSSLEVLDISYNNLSRVNFTFLSKLIYLKHFSAAYCNVTSITSIIPYLNQLLQFLDLSGNVAINLNASSLLKFYKLSSLNLSDTNMIDFTSDTLRYQKNLRTLDISSNCLRKVDLNNLSETLENLYMSGNTLNDLGTFSQKHFPKLQILFISNNNLSFEYVNQLKHDWPNVVFESDSFIQNHSGDCHQEKRVETIKNEETGIETITNGFSFTETSNRPLTFTSTQPLHRTKYTESKLETEAKTEIITNDFLLTEASRHLTDNLNTESSPIVSVTKMKTKMDTIFRNNKTSKFTEMSTQTTNYQMDNAKSEFVHFASYAFVITIPIIIVIFIAAATFFFVRCNFFSRATQNDYFDDAMAIELQNLEPIDRDEIDPNSSSGTPSYAEIHNVYDHTRYEFDPMPLSEETQRIYDNWPASTSNPNCN